MNADKIFLASWGLAIVMAGVCAIIGIGLKLNISSIFMLWFGSIGIILLSVGIGTISKSRKTANLQIITGSVLVTIAVGVLAFLYNILNMYVILAIIIIVVGIIVVTVGLSKKG